MGGDGGEGVFGGCTYKHSSDTLPLATLVLTLVLVITDICLSPSKRPLLPYDLSNKYLMS